ncbi:MAG: nodulation protein NopC [Mesorhizobium sp.]|nr:MAG: nodulation protein NopC [Mesorhizobium sp.]
MIAAIGSGVGNLGTSLIRKGHGDSKSEHSGDGKPAGGNDGKAAGGNDRADNRTVSNDQLQDNSQSAAQSEAFQSILRSFAFQFANDAMAEADEALDDTEDA